jgi:hypothetical protein
MIFPKNVRQPTLITRPPAFALHNEAEITIRRQNAPAQLRITNNEKLLSANGETPEAMICARRMLQCIIL